MAYTTLPTQSAGQVASASGWANLVKANFDSDEHVLARKTVDESVTSNTTPQNDDHLSFAMGTSQTWYLRLVLWMVGGGGDIKLGPATMPAGGVSSLEAIYLVNPGGTATSITFSEAASASIFITPSSGHVAEFHGFATTGGTAGNWQFQWAQAVSNGAATTLKKGSFLSGFQIT